MDVNGNIRSRNNLIVDNNVIAQGNINGGSFLTGGNILVAGASLLNSDVTVNSDIIGKGNASITGTSTLTGNVITTGDIVVNNANGTLQLRNGSNVNKGFLQLSDNDHRFGTNSGNTSGDVIIRMDGNDRIKFEKSGRMTLLADATPTIYLATGGITQAFMQVQGNNLRIQATSNKVYINNDLTVDDATRRVGIGTTTPEEKLHVQGTVKVSKGKLLNNENYNMLPLAYGRASGAGDKLSATANFISVDRDPPGEYKVFVNGLTNSSVILFSSMSNSVLQLVGIYPSLGYFLVLNYSFSGNFELTAFNFIVYNP